MFKVGDEVFVIRRRHGLFECSKFDRHRIKEVNPKPYFDNSYLVVGPGIDGSSESIVSKWNVFRSFKDAVKTCEYRNNLILSVESAYPEGVAYE